MKEERGGALEAFWRRRLFETHVAFAEHCNQDVFPNGVWVCGVLRRGVLAEETAWDGGV